MRIPFRWLGFLAVFSIAGCYEAEYPPQQVPSILQPVPSPYHEEPAYRIGVGDALSVESYTDPALKQQVIVRPDGRVSLILIGDVDAAGRTTQDLDEELAQRYSTLPEHPDVVVNVDQIAGLEVYVGGEVKQPSVQPIKGSLTLLQCITAAGGFMSTANPTQVLILRQQPDGRFFAYQHDVNHMLHNEAAEIYLKRHDIVFVPKTKIAVVDQYVEQYVNEILPRSIGLNFGYTFFDQVSGNSIVTQSKP